MLGHKHAGTQGAGYWSVLKCTHGSVQATDYSSVCKVPTWIPSTATCGPPPAVGATTKHTAHTSTHPSLPLPTLTTPPHPHQPSVPPPPHHVAAVKAVGVPQHCHLALAPGCHTKGGPVTRRGGALATGVIDVAHMQDAARRKLGDVGPIRDLHTTAQRHAGVYREQ